MYGYGNLIKVGLTVAGWNLRWCYLFSVELGATPKLLVVLSTGRNQISTASIKLSAPSGIHFEYGDAALDGNGETPDVNGWMSNDIYDLD